MLPRSVVLIGLPGSGKTTAGRLSARLLGAPFLDLDEMIVSSTGRAIDRVFADEGESGFRRLEHDAMARALTEPACVIAPGGGWASQPGNLEQVRDRALVIYLRVTPASAAERVGNGEGRPLLAGTDPVRRLTDLLAVREPFYRRAGHSLDTDGRSPDWVAAAIARLARTHGGWDPELVRP